MTSSTPLLPYGFPTLTAPLLTIRHPVEWRGLGLHTGLPTRVRVEPTDAPGIIFIRDGVEIPATADFVADTTRSTTLGRDGVTLSTVEHLLAALTGLNLWAARVTVDGPELPILDGSAQLFAADLLAAGAETVGTIQPLLPDCGCIEDETGTRRWSPATEKAVARFVMAGEHPLLAGQHATIEPGDSSGFLSEVAPARTWALIEQIQPLLDQGLIRGGALDNALVVYPDQYSSELRLPNEPACHKLLDLLGDLALVGRPVHAAITAHGGGHRLNVALAKRLRETLAAYAPP